MEKRTRMRNACFTAWVESLEYDERYMKYLVYGREVCPKTNKQHLQGYCEFKNPVEFSTAKRILGGDETHLASRYKESTALKASDYCKKDGDFVEFGTISKPSGKRTDLDNAVEDLEHGFTIKETALNNPVVYIKYHRGLEKFRSLFIEPRERAPEVIVLFGSTGTGKSKRARELVSDYWVWTPQRGEWFDGYDGHHNVIFEEFRGKEHISYGFLLTLLDRYECPVQVKGGTTEFIASKIVITSPTHPRWWYENLPNDSIDQLLRRIDTLIDLDTDKEIHLV